MERCSYIFPKCFLEKKLRVGEGLGNMFLQVLSPEFLAHTCSFGGLRL